MKHQWKNGFGGGPCRFCGAKPGSVRGAAPCSRKVEKEQHRKILNKQCVELLSLEELDVKTDIEEVSTWTRDQVDFAENWACAVIWTRHSKSKKKVEVPERPTFLRSRGEK